MPDLILNSVSEAGKYLAEETSHDLVSEECLVEGVAAPPTQHPIYLPLLLLETDPSTRHCLWLTAMEMDPDCRLYSTDTILRLYGISKIWSSWSFAEHHVPAASVLLVLSFWIL